MTLKLQKTVFFSALALLGMQAVSAQYNGVPFPDKTTALTIGETQNVPTIIELENFDSFDDGTNFYIDGLNATTNTDNVTDGTYWDNEANANAEGWVNSVRPASLVDIEAGGSNHVLTNVRPNEYTIYTVNVAHAGTYILNVNYKHGASATQTKDVKIYTHNINGGSKTLIYDTLKDPATDPRGADPLPNSGGVYVDTADSQPFELVAGPRLIRFRHLDAGPKFDYISFTRISALSVEENKLKANNFKVYPNPASDGQFNLNIESKWSVYTLLGAKVLEGEGKKVDLSTFAKGSYLLRTPFTSKMLIKQ